MFHALEWSCSIIWFVHPEEILLSCSADSSQKKFSTYQGTQNTQSQKITLNLHLAEGQFASFCKISAFVHPKGSISADCSSRSMCKYVCTWIHMHNSIKDSASLSWSDDYCCGDSALCHLQQSSGTKWRLMKSCATKTITSKIVIYFSWELTGTSLKAWQMQILNIQLLFKKQNDSCVIYFITAAKIILILWKYFSPVWVLIKYSHHKSKQKYERVTP